MLLPGRLSSSTLGDVLGALHRARISGHLELTECQAGAGVPGRRHTIHLRCGLVTRIESASAVPPLGEILLREGLVDRKGLSAVSLHRAAGDRRVVGEILIAGGYADVDRVQWALRTQIRERLDRLYRLPDAALRFHPARPDRTISPATPHPLTPREFLEGRPRHRDAWRTARPPRPAPRTASRPPLPAPFDDARRAALRELALPDRATDDDIRRAFRRLALETHPDRANHAGEDVQRARSARFARLSAAYHLLTR